MLTPPLAAVLYLAYAAVALPFVPFDVFDWMARALPGSMVRFGIDTIVWILTVLGLDIRDTAKTAEQLMAVLGFVVTLIAVGSVFFIALGGRRTRTMLMYGLGMGFAVAVPLIAIVLSVYGTAEVSRPVGVVWLVLVFGAWGLAHGWLQMRAPAGVAPGTVPAAAPAEERAEAAPAPEGPVRVRVGEEPAHRVQAAQGAQGPYSRRRFLLQVGGAAAAITVGGTALGGYLRVRENGQVVEPGPPISLPNEGASVEPVPGTRPEYTPLEDHYQIDINTTPPLIDADTWRLRVTGMVDSPLELTISELTTRYREVEEFVTLSCISNPIAGPLISTTLWSGVSLADVLDDAGVGEEARYVQMRSEDGFHESLSLELLRDEPRIMLAHSVDGRPLPEKHGYPLRIYIPDRYGMKQPKWITDLEVTEEYRVGYWVEREWSEEAIVQTTSVIDSVAAHEPIERGGTTFIPIGGIAYSGARGISAVEVSVDEGPWEAAEIREPISDFTWVVWRYEWPFAEGEHTFTVRCVDGEGNPQVAEESDTFPDGATGLHATTQTL